jgi:aldose 1-epimerase
MTSTESHPVSALDHQAMTSITDGIAIVEIAAHIGGTIASYRWQANGSSMDWLRPASAAAIAARDAGAMGCFPLVPYSNRIKDSRFEFEGRTIILPGTPPSDPHFEHGHGWRNPWTIAERAENAVVLRYHHAADAWPWDYEAEQAISLENGVLTITISVRNLSQSPMPLGFGLHPYFPATPLARITTKVDGMWETDSEVLPTRLVSIPAYADPANGLVTSKVELDTVFTGWSRRARIDWPELGRALEIEAEAPLNYMTLYTPANEPFFCLEPVSNITNAFNLERSAVETGQIILQPNAGQSALVRLVPHLYE